jgi:hypothetical protein
VESNEFDNVWYLSGDSIWRIFRLLAYQDVGKLIVGDSQITFKGAKTEILIDRIRRVSYGKQGRDFVNNWVKIEYDTAGISHIAFFADGNSLGWSGVLGGTARILEVVKRIPILGGESLAGAE